MHVQFTAAYDHTPSAAPRTQLAYRPDGGPARDGCYTVTRECAHAAVKAGKAVRVRAPRRPAAGVASDA